MSDSIGYKKAADGYIVKLKICGDTNEGRDKIVNQMTAKFRCSSAEVLDIYHMKTGIKINKIHGIYDPSFVYEVGKLIFSKFNANLSEVCGEGIHYFKSEEPAFYWNSYENGIHKGWYENGQLGMRCTRRGNTTYLGWVYDGLYEEWHSNGQLKMRCTRKKCDTNHLGWVYDDLYESWHYNSKPSCCATYSNGELDGLVLSWHDNGQLSSHLTYKDGEIIGPKIFLSYDGHLIN